MRLLSFPFHVSVLYEFSACSALSGLLMVFLQGVIPHHSFEWDLVWSSPLHWDNSMLSPSPDAW